MQLILIKLLPFIDVSFLCVYSGLVPLFVWGYCCCETRPTPPAIHCNTSSFVASKWPFHTSSCERFVLHRLLYHPKHSLAHVPSWNSCLSVCLSMIFHSRGCCCCCSAIIPSLNRFFFGGGGSLEVTFSALHLCSS